MPGFDNTPTPEASHRLGISFVLSLVFHLAVLFWPPWQLRDVTSVAAAHRAGALSARLVIPGLGAVPPADEFQLPADASTADAAEFGLQDRAQGGNIARIQKETYEIDEVDVRPWIKTRIMPEYPPMLPPGIAATTILSFVVDENGRIGDIEVESPAPDPLFDLFAMRAFANASYTQALVDRRPVKVRMRIAITFNSPASP